MKSLLLLAFVGFCTLAPACRAQGLTWTQITPLSAETPGARIGGAFGYDGVSNQLILFSGSGGGLPNDTWLYDVATGMWEQVTTTSAPVGRVYPFYGVVNVSGESVFVVSHGTGAEEYGDTWAFSFVTRQWSEVTTEGPVPPIRYGGHFGAVYGPATNEFWMGAGFTLTTTFATRYIDTYKLIFSTPTTATWRRVFGQPTVGNQFNPLAPHGRCLQGSAVVRPEQLVIFGGCTRGGTAGGPCPINDGWYFNRNKWKELPRCITPRTWSRMAPLSNDPGKAVFYGGYSFHTEQIINVKDWPGYEVAIVDVDRKDWTRYKTAATVPDVYPDRRQRHMMAAGPNGDVYVFGGRRLSDDSSMNDLWLLSGDPAETETMSCDDQWFSYLHLHGFLMATAFGILFPTGFVVARYIRCSKSKLWFYLHFTVQVLGVLMTMPAFVIIFLFGSVEPTHPHAIIGIILETLVIFQAFIGIFRPHLKRDGSKSTWRKIWEWIHRIWGLSVISIGLVQVTLGVFLLIPPVPVWAIWITMLILWVIAFIVIETIKCIHQYRKPSAGGKEPLESDEFELKYKHP